MNAKNTQSGFTLIEVLMAIGIFSFGVLALASMQMTSLQGNDRANIGSEATTIAGDKLEELMTLNYPNPPMPTPPYPDPLPLIYDPLNPLNDRTNDGLAGLLDEANADFSENPPGTQGNFTVFWNIADISIGGAAIPNAKQITVIVRWVGSDAIQHRVIMTSIRPELDELGG